MSESAPEIHALVVGAGPTGLLAACELIRHGVRCRLVEELAEPSPLSRALGVHARTLEILEDVGAGVADAICEQGVKMVGASIHANGKRIAHVSFEELQSRYAFVVSLPQSRTEAILTEHLESLGGAVERSVTFDGFRQDASGVSSTLRHADGREETVRTRWLIGCDGAHSAVRKAMGQEFAGHRIDEVFALADVRVSWALPADHVNSFFSEEGMLVVFPLPDGRARIIATVDPKGDGDEDEARLPPTLEQIVEILRQRADPAVEVSDPDWLSTFRVSYRLTPRYRDGRVFLAGDAAHIHSPVGGQGMNTGLQDAYNLAWKLGLVDRGVGRTRLLDSYEAERRAIAQSVLEATERATQVATIRNPVGRAIRNRIATFLTGLEVIQQRITSTTAGLSISYHDSPIVEERQSSLLAARIGSDQKAESATVSAWRGFRTGPAAGARAPDGTVSQRGREDPVRLFELMRGTRHVLLLFDGEAQTEPGYENLAGIASTVVARYGEFVDAHVVVPRAHVPDQLSWDGSVLLDPEGDLQYQYGARAECLYLIRPDGYVGYRSQPADGEKLLRYLSEVFV